MEIKGKIVIFPEKKHNEKGDFIICKGTISSKDKDGNYLNKSVEVKFDKERFPREKVNALDPTKCYQLEVEKGYLVVDGYKNTEGKPVTFINLFVEEGRLSGEPKVVNRSESNKLPF